MTCPTPVERVSTVALLRGDRHLLADVADRQRDVDRRIGVDLQDDALLHVGVEALEGNFRPVRPDRKVRKDVGAVGAGEPCAACPCRSW